MFLKKKKILLYAVACYIFPIEAFFPINVFRPYDINLHPTRWQCKKFQTTWYAEGALQVRGADPHNNHVNVMQLWNPVVVIDNVVQGGQNSLAMLAGFPDNSPMTQFLTDLPPNGLGNPIDNNVRGHFDVRGDLKIHLSSGVSARYYLPHDFIIGLHLPWYAMQLKNVKFFDLTQAITAQDLVVKTELTDQIFTKVHEFDPALNLHGWKKAGIGDFVIMAEWWHNFCQQKPILKNVTLEARLGISMPTGVKTDEGDILSIPFGFDGAAGIIFAGGIWLNWWDCLRGGFDIEFTNIFGNTRERRIKVDRNQTEFLLLEKTLVHKDFGFTQHYNLFLESYQWYDCISARFAYDFWHHGDDRVTVGNNNFSNDIANSAESLQEWTIHQFILKFDYDCQHYFCNNSLLSPQFSVYFKLPFNGRRALLATMVGGVISLSF